MYFRTRPKFWDSTLLIKKKLFKRFAKLKLSFLFPKLWKRFTSFKYRKINCFNKSNQKKFLQNRKKKLKFWTDLLFKSKKETILPKQIRLKFLKDMNYKNLTIKKLKKKYKKKYKKLVDKDRRIKIIQY